MGEKDGESMSQHYTDADRERIINDVQRRTRNGQSLKSACAELKISDATYRAWKVGTWNVRAHKTNTHRFAEAMKTLSEIGKTVIIAIEDENGSIHSKIVNCGRDSNFDVMIDLIYKQRQNQFQIDPPKTQAEFELEDKIIARELDK